MIVTNITEFKTNLSKFIRLLESGKEEEIVICRGNEKILKMVLFDGDEKNQRVGVAKGQLEDKEFELKKGFEDIPQLFGY